MNAHSHARHNVGLVAIIIGLLFLLLAPSASAAGWRDSDDRWSRHYDKRGSYQERYCNHIAGPYARRGWELPYFCKDEEPEPEAPTLDFDADPAELPAGATTTLSWTSENADSCEASDDWSGDKAVNGSEEVTLGTSTATYTITCTGEGGDATESVTVTVETPDPEPSVDHVVISEVLYDPDTGQGAESTNEWVELYNPTDSPVDLIDWEIGDGSSNDVIADSSLVLNPGEYLVIANSTTTADFWDFTGVSVVFLESPITSLGLANGSDSVKLFDASAAEVDAVSYGIDTSAFDPAAPDVDPGSSLWRSDPNTDTDTAADWSENVAPSPGS